MDNISIFQKCQDIIAILFYICQALFWRSVFYTRHFYLLLTNPNYKPQTSQPQQSQTALQDEIFANKYVSKFLKTFDDGYNVNVNENVHRVFYDATELNAELQIENNELELVWKRRVLQETTPRGNIVMYYDPFRLAFVYYADTHIPYPILNSVAIHYVLMYRCRDLFMDEFVYPLDHTSPLIRVLINPVKKISDNSIIPNNIKNAPFAKLKSNTNSIEASGIKRVSETTKRIKTNQASDKKKIMNTFVCLGKVMDFPLFQITKPKPKQLPLSTNLSYAEFMKKKSAPTLTKITQQLEKTDSASEHESALDYSESESGSGSDYELVNQ